MRYESTDWNKDGAKTFSEEQGNLLIIAAKLNDSDVLKVLIQDYRIDPSVNNNEALLLRYSCIYFGNICRWRRTSMGKWKNEKCKKYFTCIKTFINPRTSNKYWESYTFKYK